MKSQNNLSGVNRLGEVNCPSGIVRFPGGGMPSVDSGQFLINAMSTALPGLFNPGHMLLLPDGRVMVQDDGNTDWQFLSPDGSGHYGDGS